MRAAVAFMLTLVLVAVAPATAEAVVLVSPAENASVSSTPSFSWRLAPGEQAFSLEISPNPAPGEGGGFADDVEKRQALLQDTQTGYVVGNRDPLFPGVWFWHVNFVNANADSRWSPTRRIVVRDEPIELLTFNFMNFSCSRQMSVEFTYADNSLRQLATYRVEFRRRKRGRRIASIRGRTDEGRLFRTFRRPRALRRGKRYFVRLEVRDRGGHVDRSGFRRTRIRSC